MSTVTFRPTVGSLEITYKDPLPVSGKPSLLGREAKDNIVPASPRAQCGTYPHLPLYCLHASSATVLCTRAQRSGADPTTHSLRSCAPYNFARLLLSDLGAVGAPWVVSRPTRSPFPKRRISYALYGDGQVRLIARLRPLRRHPVCCFTPLWCCGAAAAAASALHGVINMLECCDSCDCDT